MFIGLDTPASWYVAARGRVARTINFFHIDKRVNLGYYIPQQGI